MVVIVLLICLAASVTLLNRFVENQMRLTYNQSVHTLFNAFEDGVKGSLERGQMKNFQKLLHHQKEINGVMEVNLYDRKGAVNPLVQYPGQGRTPSGRIIVPYQGRK